MFYLVLGTNGLVLHADKGYAEKSKPYLKYPTVHTYTSFQEAHRDALECLRDILPDEYPLPNRVPQRKLITKHKYFECFPQLAGKVNEDSNNEVQLEKMGSLNELPGDMLHIEINA